MFQSVQSLDQQVLADQLRILLARSPATAGFVAHRVQEIVGDLLSGVVALQLRTRIQELEDMVGQLQQQCSIANMSHSKSQQKSKSLLHKYQQTTKTLKQTEQQLQILQSSQSNLNQLQTTNKLLQSEINTLKEQTHQDSLSIAKYKQELEKVTDKLEKEVKEGERKADVIYKMEREVEKLRRICKETRVEGIRSKKEGEAMETSYENVLAQLTKAKDELALQRRQRDNQRKAFNTKLSQLSLKARKLEKIKKKLTSIQLQNRKLRKQTQTLIQDFQNSIQSLSNEASEQTHRILDKIGEEVNREVKELMSQISKTNAEVRIYRQELRIKDEIIDKLEKVSAVHVMGNRELQRELKAKKAESEGLRTELKKNFEESETRLMGLENQYRQILVSSASKVR